MSTLLSASTIEALSAQTREPAWVRDLRLAALARHQSLPWPHPSDDIWRRTDIAQLDPTGGFSLPAPSLLESVALSQDQLSGWMNPLAGEMLFTRMNGSWVTEPEAGPLQVQTLAQAAAAHPEHIRACLSCEGLSPAEQKLQTLNGALHNDDVVITVPAETTIDRPVRFVHVLAPGPQQAVFPLTVIRVGAGSAVTLIDEYVSLDAEGSSAPHLINAHIELALEPNARVRYVRLQRWGAQAREFLLQRATLGQGAELTMANLNLGASVSKAHVITRLAGERASSRLCGFVFGHGKQHIDQHTLQDHLAAHTQSDLQFRAALQDQSRMVYTGLIRIAPSAAQTDAYQSNHNLLLSRQAQAETIPMLEILADDVRCKHGASVGPIDEEQIFFLMARGVPRAAAERLIVMGFIEPILQEIPFEPLQERLRAEIEGNLREESGEPAVLAAAGVS